MSYELDIHGSVDSSFKELIQINCMFAGHSFAERFRQWVQSNANPFDQNLLIDRVGEISWVTRSGGTVSDFFQEFIISNNKKLHNTNVLLLDIGGNDLDDHTVGIDTLVQSVYSLVTKIKTRFPALHVVWLQLLHRQQTRNKPTDLYNNQVDAVNAALKSRLGRLQGITYWCHRALWKNKSLMHRDGIHLSPSGLLLYARSVRGAVLKAIAESF